MDNPDRIYEPWHIWTGSSPVYPVDGNEGVTIRQRRGQEFDTETPWSWKGWEHDGSGSDIIAYRRWRPK